jgi:TM2 domain-containing membrane protein YozV
VHSRTCNVLILMCHGGVGSILVMFDVLDCYILYMCLLPFIYYTLYNCFGGSPAGEADKIGFFLKKSLCSSVP